MKICQTNRKYFNSKAICSFLAMFSTRYQKYIVNVQYNCQTFIKQNTSFLSDQEPVKRNRIFILDYDVSK